MRLRSSELFRKSRSIRRPPFQPHLDLERLEDRTLMTVQPPTLAPSTQSLPVELPPGSGTLPTLGTQTGSNPTSPVTITEVQDALNKKHQVREIIFTFSGSVNATEAGETAIYRLATPGKKGSYTAKNAGIVKLRSAVYTGSTDTVVLTPKKPFVLTKPVQLQINGSAPSGLQDSAGQFIGGDAITILAKKDVTMQ